MKSARPASAIHCSARIATLFFRYLLPVLCIPTTVIAQNANSAQFEIQHIHGVVVNALDNKPVGRVLVSSPDRRMATMTDYEGRFSFDVRRPVASASPNPGNSVLSPIGVARSTQGMMVGITATRPGFLPRQTQLRISSVPQTGVQTDSQSEAESGAEDLRIRIVPEAVIHGHVSLPSDARTTGMQVQLRRKEVQDGMAVWLPVGGAQANSHGDFRIADLPAGDYKVMIPGRTDRQVDRGAGASAGPDEVSGYAPAYYGDTADLTSSPAIHLAAGETFEANLTPRAATFYRVTIPVAGMTAGEPWGVSVGEEDDPAGFQMSFDSRTNHVEGFLPNGSYDIHVSGSGEKPTSGHGKIQVAGRPVNAAAIALLPHGQIPIFVTRDFTATTDDNANQRPATPPGVVLSIPSVQVSLESFGFPTQGANLKYTPGDSNQLLLENVQEGKYRVVVRPNRGYVASMTSNGVDLMRQPLVVGPGGVSEPIQITLRDDSATVSGTVSTGNLAADTQGQSYFLIVAYRLKDNFIAPQLQAAAVQGLRFTLPNVPPGEYLVLAADASTGYPPFNLEYQNPDVMRDYMSKGTVVSVSAGQKIAIQVPVLPEEDK